jgi:diguanylate cyclase (GGDEF)-like protein
MVTAVVAAACAVVAACGFTLVALRRARAQSDRRLDAVLGQVERHLEAMSADLARSVDAVAEIVEQRPSGILSLDFDELLDSLVAEVARRTGADAVVLRVEGPAGRPFVAVHGAVEDAGAVDRSFRPPSPRAFDAAVIDWIYSPVAEAEDAAFRSALMLPLAETTAAPGVLAVFAHAADAFGADEAGAVRALLADIQVALANARRFAELEARVNVDPLTGVQNRRGYELELEREVARASRAGAPLSVVVVGIGEQNGQTGTATGGRIGEIARLVTHVTRRTDISCRRGDRELAIILPGTEEAGAAVLTRRIESEARSVGAGPSTVTVGLVAHRRDETPEALDGRIDRLLGHPRGATVSALDDARNASTAAASTTRSTVAAGARPEPADAVRRDALAAIARELGAARRYERSLGLVVLEVGGLDDVAERDGREEADVTLAGFAGRLDRSLGAGSAHRLGANTFALVLPGSGLHEAEALVDTLQSALEPPHDETGLVLSAGITEAVEEDAPEVALGRAEHALWQAKQAGAGTVVVAVPGKRST